MAANKKVSSISKANSLEKMGEFWDAHDFTDFDDPNAPDVEFTISCAVPIAFGRVNMKKHNSTARFAICVNNEGYLASLELRKIYQVLPDVKAAKHQLIRVIDESGEDYLYPASFFVPIKLPITAKKSFALAA